MFFVQDATANSEKNGVILLRRQSLDGIIVRVTITLPTEVRHIRNATYWKLTNVPLSKPNIGDGLIKQVGEMEVLIESKQRQMKRLRDEIEELLARLEAAKNAYHQLDEQGFIYNGNGVGR